MIFFARETRSSREPTRDRTKFQREPDALAVASALFAAKKLHCIMEFKRKSDLDREMREATLSSQEHGQRWFVDTAQHDQVQWTVPTAFARGIMAQNGRRKPSLFSDTHRDFAHASATSSVALSKFFHFSVFPLFRMVSPLLSNAAFVHHVQPCGGPFRETLTLQTADLVDPGETESL